MDPAKAHRSVLLISESPAPRHASDVDAVVCVALEDRAAIEDGAILEDGAALEDGAESEEGFLTVLREKFGKDFLTEEFSEQFCNEIMAEVGEDPTELAQEVCDFYSEATDYVSNTVAPALGLVKSHRIVCTREYMGHQNIDLRFTILTRKTGQANKTLNSLLVSLSGAPLDSVQIDSAGSEKAEVIPIHESLEVLVTSGNCREIKLHKARIDIEQQQTMRSVCSGTVLSFDRCVWNEDGYDFFVEEEEESIEATPMALTIRCEGCLGIKLEYLVKAVQDGKLESLKIMGMVSDDPLVYNAILDVASAWGDNLNAFTLEESQFEVPYLTKTQTVHSDSWSNRIREDLDQRKTRLSVSVEKVSAVAVESMETKKQEESDLTGTPTADASLATGVAEGTTGEEKKEEESDRTDLPPTDVSPAPVAANVVAIEKASSVAVEGKEAEEKKEEESEPPPAVEDAEKSADEECKCL